MLPSTVIFVDNLLLLQKHNVTYYWIISPEDRSLIVYKLIDDKYSIIEAFVDCEGSVRIEPFVESDFDLNYMFEQ